MTVTGAGLCTTVAHVFKCVDKVTGGIAGAFEPLGAEYGSGVSSPIHTAEGGLAKLTI